MDSLKSRFEEKYIPEPNSGCWLWLGAVTPLGYGKISVARSKWTGAHRVAWGLHRGPIPKGKIVCHICDNPSCVNPDHLFIGTNKENTADCLRKGRFRGSPRRGEDNGRAILSEEQVKRILQSQLNPKLLAEKYGVHWATIYKIKRGKLWSNLYAEANHRAEMRL